MSDPKTVFETYLKAFTRGDIETAADLLTDDFEFHGPMLQSKGKPAFVDGASQLLPMVRGYKMLRQWVDGDEVCSVYDFEIETPKGRGAITMTEWNRVRGGKLASGRLIFNTPDFMALMPAPPQ